MTPEDVISFYERNAYRFDGSRSRDLLEKPWIDRFLRFVPRNGSILELGCGSGRPIAEYFVKSGYRVTGVDTSPTLIGMCKRRFPDHRWIVADMRKVEFITAFDGVLAWDSFFHLPHSDQRVMIRAFRSFAKPGASVLFNAGSHHGEATNPLWGAPLYHASFSKDEYTELMTQAGFATLSAELDDPQSGGRSIYFAR